MLATRRYLERGEYFGFTRGRWQCTGAASVASTAVQIAATRLGLICERTLARLTLLLVSVVPNMLCK